jgi:predicted amino acid racemase
VNRVIINLEALKHNLEVIDGWMRERGSAWTVVTKVLCGHRETLRALWAMGVRSVGDSRLRNMRSIREAVPEPGPESWYLRVPNLSSVVDVVRLSEVSLNSETEIIEALDEEAARQGRTHGIIIMIELGDLREGILPGSLIRFYEQVFELGHIDVLGIGGNLGCISGQVPTVDQYMQLVLYRELLELRFGHRLPLISAGSSVTLPMLLDGQLPLAVNHFRVGESLFLGNNLLTGAPLPGLRTDTVVLEAEIVEIKKKSLVPVGSGGSVAPFANEINADLAPGQRGYRVLVNVGHLDTETRGLQPEDPSFQIAGASSDITVVNVGDDPGDLKVGDTMRFRLNYAAMLRLMSSPYVPKVVSPSLPEFEASLPDGGRLPVPPVLPELQGAPRPRAARLGALAVAGDREIGEVAVTPEAS